LITEYWNGESLMNKSKKNENLNDAEIGNIVKQILSGLQYAHDRGLIHSNINPRNISVNSNGQVKILDFGLSCLVNNHFNFPIRNTGYSDSIFFMSPEQVKGLSGIDYRSDIYSLGVTLYYILNGETPYNSNVNSPFEIYNRIVFEPLIVSMDNQFDIYISKACQKDPNLRFLSCYDWFTEMSFLEGENESEKLKSNFIDENKQSSDQEKLNNSGEQKSPNNSIHQAGIKEKHNFSSKAEMLGYYIGKNLRQNSNTDNKKKGNSNAFRIDHIVFVVTVIFFLSFLTYTFFRDYPVDGYRNYFEKFFNPNSVNIRNNNNELKSSEEQIDEEILVEDEPFVLDTNRYDEKTNEYFDEIVMHSEFGKGRRSEPFVWTTDMKIYVDGERPEYLMDELERIVDELNGLIQPLLLSIVSSPSEANFKIYIGSHFDFKRKYKLLAPNRLDSNFGYFESGPNSGVMFIDTYRNGDEISQKHLLREELTQSLGLYNDSWKYPNSIFYQGWTTTTEYSEMDKRLIDLLYN
jgi:serine/threonine protein kinase